jgi:hypothetical protein
MKEVHRCDVVANRGSGQKYTRTSQSKNVEVMPSSFVVRADKNGQVVTLVIHSDGKTISYLVD